MNFIGKRICIGADPDLTDTSIAIIDYDSGVLLYGLVVHSSHKKNDKQGVKLQRAIRDVSREMHIHAHGEDSTMGMAHVVAAAIESQEPRHAVRKGARTTDLITLATVSGAVAGSVASLYPNMLLLPKPWMWKGNVPKQVHQARIFSAMGMGYIPVGKNPSDGYCRPKDPPDCVKHIKQTHWKHLADAIGLARYARKKARMAEKVDGNIFKSDNPYYMEDMD